MGDHDVLNDINFSYGILKSRASVQRQLREDYLGMDRVSSPKTVSKLEVIRALIWCRLPVFFFGI